MANPTSTSVPSTGAFQLGFYGSAAPTGANPPLSPPVVAVLDALGNLPIPGSVISDQASGGAGLNGGYANIDMQLARSGSTLLTGASATNTWFVTNTVGSISVVQLATEASTGLQTAAFRKQITMPTGYVANTPVTLDVIYSLTGGGSATAVQLRAQLYPYIMVTGSATLANVAGTLGASLSASGTLVTLNTPSTVAAVLSFGQNIGTAAGISPGTPALVEIDGSLTGVSGTTNLTIFAVNMR